MRPIRVFRVRDCYRGRGRWHVVGTSTGTLYVCTSPWADAIARAQRIASQGAS